LRILGDGIMHFAYEMAVSFWGSWPK
jgi:hypothetical protein